MNSSYNTKKDNLSDYFHVNKKHMHRKIFLIHDKMQTLSENDLWNFNIVTFHLM